MANKKKRYLDIAEDMQRGIEEGRFTEGQKMPTVRSLAEKYGTTVVTVTNALKKLDSDGWVIRKPGSGVFVRKHETLGALPASDLKEIFARIIDEDGAAAFSYEDPTGYPGLKTAIKAYAADEYHGSDESGKSVEVDKGRQVLITSGTQQALHLVFSSMLNFGDWVLVENPTYPAALRMLKEQGARIETISMGQYGPDPRELKRIFESRPLRMVYTMPNFQNPTGCSYSSAATEELAKLAEQHGVYIVEDTSYGDLNFHGESGPPPRFHFPPDLHILLSTYSYTFLPGARIGCCICPESVYYTLSTAKIDQDLFSSGFFQRALARYIKSGKYAQRLSALNRRAAEMYKEAFSLLKTVCRDIGLGEDICIPGDGGYSFWCVLPESLSTAEQGIASGIEVLRPLTEELKRRGSFIWTLEPGAPYLGGWNNGAVHAFCLRFSPSDSI
ncbi:MAG: PLP-dependent aminotransferase family protein [Spirochaetia bacterium]|nr:PLP-dependent aminotransferase family protein [Spirochaetia bacterium]